MPCSLPSLTTPLFPTHLYTVLHTTLGGQAHKSEIHVGKDLGIPVELIDPTVYEGGENLQMHPHDEELLRDPSQTKAAYVVARSNSLPDSCITHAHFTLWLCHASRCVYRCVVVMSALTCWLG